MTSLRSSKIMSVILLFDILKWEKHIRCNFLFLETLWLNPYRCPCVLCCLESMSWWFFLIFVVNAKFYVHQILLESAGWIFFICHFVIKQDRGKSDLLKWSKKVNCALLLRKSLVSIIGDVKLSSWSFNSVLYIK